MNSKEIYELEISVDPYSALYDAAMSYGYDARRLSGGPGVALVWDPKASDVQLPTIVFHSPEDAMEWIKSSSNRANIFSTSSGSL